MIAVIVPCYNEEKRLKVSAFQSFVQENTDYHFYFVDDGSIDDTYIILYDSFKHHPRATVLRTNINLGKGEAIRYAVKRIECEEFKRIAFIDADLEIPLSQLFELHKAFDLTPELLACLSTRNDSGLSSVSPVRRFGSSIIRKISSYLIGFKIPIRDTQCGCKMFSVNVLDVFDDPFISSWLFDIEIILRLRDNYDNEGNLIKQIPLHNLNTVDGKVNYDAIAVWKLVQQINKIHRCYN